MIIMIMLLLMMRAKKINKEIKGFPLLGLVVAADDEHDPGAPLLVGLSSR